jgi:predicted ATPase
VRPEFELTEANAAPVAALCAHLDGLPLAIEMAAAQSRRLSPQRLLAQLDAKLVALGGGMRDRSPRQQTLRGAIDWSYELLSAQEKRLFNSLGVFVGGFDWQAIVGLLADDEPAFVGALSENLTNLTEMNLVQMEAARCIIFRLPKRRRKICAVRRSRNRSTGWSGSTAICGRR